MFFNLREELGKKRLTAISLNDYDYDYNHDYDYKPGLTLNFKLLNPLSSARWKICVKKKDYQLIFNRIFLSSTIEHDKRFR